MPLWIQPDDHPGWLVISAQPLTSREPRAWQATILAPQAGYRPGGLHTEQSVILIPYGQHGEDWWMEFS